MFSDISYRLLPYCHSSEWTLGLDIVHFDGCVNVYRAAVGCGRIVPSKKATREALILIGYKLIPAATRVRLLTSCYRQLQKRPI